MNKRRRRIYQKQFISDEKVIVGYHRRHPEKEPDGSFVMDVFMKGYRLGLRDAKKKAEGAS